MRGPVLHRVILKPFMGFMTKIFVSIKIMNLQRIYVMIIARHNLTLGEVKMLRFVFLQHRLKYLQ